MPRPNITFTLLVNIEIKPPMQTLVASIKADREAVVYRLVLGCPTYHTDRRYMHVIGRW